MTKILTLAAAVAAFALVSFDASASQKGASRTCNPGDQLIELKDGKLRCWEEGKTLPQGATVVRAEQKGKAAPQPKTAAVAPSVAPAKTFSLADFAQRAESCLAAKNIFSAKQGEKGCFVGGDGRVHCTEPGHDEVVQVCIAEANGSGRPARWNQ